MVERWLTKPKQSHAKFIGQFKVGDNMIKNAEVLCKMAALNDNQFNKLMVVQTGSLVEAALEQIIYRAQNFSKEGVPNISEADRAKIADTDYEQFNSIINAMKKYKLLDGLGANIYDELHTLRQYRNRVHIQNDSKPKDISADEDKAFTKQIVNWSLALNIKVLKFLNDNYARPKELEQFAHELKVPTSI